MGGPAPRTIGPGTNDREFLESDNWVSNTLNSGVGYMMGLGGFDTTRRGEQGDGDATGRAPGDNSFYRDNADMMPGWGNTFGLDFMDPNGHPSGATAQDRATNYVGKTDPTGVWGDVRANLVTNESAAIGRARAAGESHIGFGDVYSSHVSAYADAQAADHRRDPKSTSGNTFIDPASFALAMYGAPLIEHLGINAGPITGASIDAFNDPTDSVGDGWAKRMALSGGEIGVGAGATALGANNLLRGNLLTGGAELAGGVGLMGLGAFSGAWNTATAIGNGMGVSEAVSGLDHLGGSLASAGGTMAGDAASAVGSAASAASGVASSAWHGLSSLW